MVRGKHGGAAETRRNAAADETIQALRTQLAEVRRDAAREVQEVRAELARARATMRADAERLAKDGIRAAREATAAAVAEWQRRHDARVDDVVAVLRKYREAEADRISTSYATWLEIAEALGVEPGRLWLENADGTLQPRSKRRNARPVLVRFDENLTEDGRVNFRSGPPGGMVNPKRPK